MELHEISSIYHTTTDYDWFGPKNFVGVSRVGSNEFCLQFGRNNGKTVTYVSKMMEDILSWSGVKSYICDM